MTRKTNEDDLKVNAENYLQDGEKNKIITLFDMYWKADVINA